MEKRGVFLDLTFCQKTSIGGEGREGNSRFIGMVDKIDWKSAQLI